MNTLDRYNELLFAYQYDYSEGNKSCNGDIEYYIDKFASTNGKVLELGCGTARITIPLKKSGVDITGLDHAQAMIEIATAKASKEELDIQFIVDDATSFSCSKNFQAIFMPYNSICFIGNERINTFVKNIEGHLTSGGKFLFDISKMSPELFDDNGKRFVDWSKPLFITELNINLRRKMEITYKKDQNITDSIYFWESTNSSGQVEHKQTTMQFSNYDSKDYINIFENNGFQLTDILNIPFTRGSIERVHTFVELTKI